MHKIIFSVIAALMLVTPLFAQEIEESSSTASAAPAEISKTELVLKLEIAPSGQLDLKKAITGLLYNIEYPSEQQASEAGFNATAELYYYPVKFLGLGFGVKQQFDRKIENFGEIAITNFYVSVKPKLTLPADWGIDYVYGLFQGGYGLFIHDYKLSSLPTYDLIPTKTEGGLYYAAGIGCEFNNFVFELLFCVNESTIKANGIVESTGEQTAGSLDAKYTTTNINIGYKFNL
ncbi:hypothetical protein [Endomicrobium proavitum]|uniref:Outer membrane protein beta-barrel domain-containing protein n=1 Tax=Endomicrobium proavitum TaxID=1408281 RepID=A0A0G3WJQ7_9BACT|nr:hypothetical protein [Endomicrobium proavitum]AKL98097.1 exported protein of unknown function [Endomicrobium proavitum]